MKIMTCKQLGGACEKKFTAAAFDEILAMNLEHSMEMAEKADRAHLQAIYDMRKAAKTDDAMKQWVAGKKQEFAALPDE
jgi:hypothetical protein